MQFPAMAEPNLHIFAYANRVNILELVSTER